MAILRVSQPSFHEIEALQRTVERNYRIASAILCGAVLAVLATGIVFAIARAS